MANEHLGGESIFLKGGERAVLFLHGFTSTTQALLPIGEKLAVAGYTVSLPLIPGHGTTPEDMAAYTYKDWVRFALEQYDELAKKYKHPAVIGFSMGGALGVHIAANRAVPLYVALAPALYLQDWRLIFLPLLKIFMPWKKSIGNDIKGTQFQEKSYSRFHFKNLEDLLQVMKIARRDLPNLNIPLLGIQSTEDHTIPPSCLDYLMKYAASEIKEKHRLTNSYHVLTLDNEYLQVADWIIAFLQKYWPNTQ